MRLALIGDIHMYCPLVPPWELIGKGIAGQLNVWFNRYWHFDRALLPKLLERVEAIKPDVLLLSGDLTSIAAAAEFRRVAAVMLPLIRRLPTVAVPGNHDRYTLLSKLRGRMERALPGCVPERFPFLRDLTEWWKLLAVDAAAPGLTAQGRIGAAQLDRVRAIIGAIKPGQGLIVMGHYDLGVPPPLDPPSRGHQLADAAELLEIFRQSAGPIVYLHGHVHKPWCWRRIEPGLTHVLDVDAGAPLARSERFPAGQGFWQIDLPPGPAALENIGLIHHVLGGEPVAAVK